MAELRKFRGWTAAELAERLDALEEVPPSVDEAARREMSAGTSRWHPTRVEEVVGHEPPGTPVEGGGFQRARRGIVEFRFSEPSIVRAYFDRSRPLRGRRMLLEIQVLGLHYLCGTVVSAVREERTEEESVFGFRYDTLEGHIERGEEWFVLRKDHASGAIRFTIASRWCRGDLPNWWSRLGFPVLSGHYRALWLRRAYARIRAMVEGGGLREAERGRVYGLATGIGALSGARSMAGPWTAAVAARGADEGIAHALGGRMALTSAMALGEAFADKYPRIPARTTPFAWLGRVAAGAFGGAAVASHLERDALAGALLGGAAAAAVTKLSYEGRARLGDRMPGVVAGLVEDALVFGLGLVLAAAVRRTPPDAYATDR